MHNRLFFFMVTIISIKYLYQIKVHTFHNIVKSLKKNKQSHKKTPGRLYRRSDIDIEFYRLPQTVVLKKKKVRSTPQCLLDFYVKEVYFSAHQGVEIDLTDSFKVQITDYIDRCSYSSHIKMNSSE